MFKKILSSALLFLSLSSFATANEIVVGGKFFTEQFLLASMTEQLLADRGFDVDKKDGLGSNVVRKAQLNNQVDIYWEYTGTALIAYHKFKEKLPNQQAYYEKAKTLDEPNNIIWLNPSSANNTFALAVRKNDPKMANVNSISDLSDLMKKDKSLRLASGIEFPVRPDGLKPLQRLYKFKFKRSNLIKMDDGLTYQALKLKEVDVAMVFATDGRIGAFDFKVLKDNKNFFPNYAIVPVVRKEIA